MMEAEDVKDSAARDPSSGEILKAGPLLLDLRRGEVRSSGVPLPLNGKAFAVLRLLMISENRLVTKDELFENVWPGVIVSEAALTTAIKEIRQAIGDNARDPHFIRTVHRRGYRSCRP